MRPVRWPRGRLARIMCAYGWRAYALPVLVVLTGLAVLDSARTPASETAAQAGQQRASQQSRPLIPNPGGGGFAAAKVSAELPGGGPFTEQADGT